MSALSCTNCGSSDLESDSARGDTVCTKCGSVLEDNLIVSEVQFEEGTRGAAHVVGQMVSAESSFKALSVGNVIGSGKESRQVTLENAKRKIRSVGSQLRLNNHCIDTAFNFYKMALNRRLTHGRKNSHVIAACIYITCRIESTSHMLLDLSDVTQVNVYDLGRTYLKLSSALCINIPAIDPCLYIVRFANRLNLGSKTHEVEMTALRLVQRMKRDWMHTGRRPSGLCGAALLVGARLNDVHCTIKDIIQVVKVCETTIRKRLNEFGDTPSSKLTLEEFMTVDLEDEEDPPCYKVTRKKIKQHLEDKQKLQDCEEQISQLQKLIDQDLEKNRKKIRGLWSKYAQVSECESDIDENSVTEHFIAKETLNTVCEIIDEDSVSERESYELHLKALTERPTAASLKLTENFGLIDEEENQNELNESLADSGLGFSQDDNLPKAIEENGELDITDLNDEEIDSYLLTPSEIEAKTKLWMKINADYLKEVEEKEKRKREEEELRKEKEAQGEIQPKKKRKTKKRQPIQASNAGEAIEKMLQEKRISNKINYEVLKKLSGNLTNNNESHNVENEDSSTNSALKRLPSMRNFIDVASNNLRTSLYKTKQNKPLLSSTSTSSINNQPDNTVALYSIANELDVVNEEAVDDEYEEEYADDDYGENENKEEHLSIAQLMTQHRGEEDLDAGYEYDDECYD